MFAVFARQWWILALRGLLALLFGMLAVLLPHFTLVFLVVLFGVYALMDGLSSLLTALFASWEKASERWVQGLEGIAGLAVGILILLWPTFVTGVFFALLAVWALVGGSFMLLSALRLHRSLQGEVLLVLSGLSALAFGVLLFLFPKAGVIAVAWVIGLYALLSGALLLARAIRLRRRMQQHQHWLPPQDASGGEDEAPGQAKERPEPQPLGQRA